MGEQQPTGKKHRQAQMTQQKGGPNRGKPRRFAVGDPVVCDLGSQVGWKPGAVSMVDVCGNFDIIMAHHCGASGGVVVGGGRWECGSVGRWVGGGGWCGNFDIISDHLSILQLPLHHSAHAVCTVLFLAPRLYWLGADWGF